MAVPNVPMPNIPLLSMRTYAPRQMDRDLARVFEARGLSPVAGARLQAARVEVCLCLNLNQLRFVLHQFLVPLACARKLCSLFTNLKVRAGPGK